MRRSKAIAAHYTRGDLLAAVRAGVDALGKTPETVTIDDLAPVDEFHIGGREATEDFLGQLALESVGFEIICERRRGRFAIDFFGRSGDNPRHPIPSDRRAVSGNAARAVMPRSRPISAGAFDA